MTKILSKADILSASDLVTQTVDVPEWGGSVIVAGMTGAARDAFEASMITIDADGKRVPDMANMRAKLIALTLVDESGVLLFSHEDIAALAEKSASAIERVFEVAQKLNGLAPGATVVAEKNSEPGPSVNSASD